MFSKSSEASAQDQRPKMNPATANLKIPRRVTVMRLLPAWAGVQHGRPVIGAGCPPRRALFSVKLFRHRLPVGILHQRHVGHWMAVLQLWGDAHDPIALVLFCGLRSSCLEGTLGFGHGFSLRLGMREVVPLCDG